MAETISSFELGLLPKLSCARLYAQDASFHGVKLSHAVDVNPYLSGAAPTPPPTPFRPPPGVADSISP